MTRSHIAPPAGAPNLPAAITTLRARGLRLSSARRLVLEARFRAGEPITAEAIASGLDGRLPPSDLGSVYRNLERLEALGLVRHVHLGHGPGHYAPADGRGDDLVVCESCGAVRALAPGAFDDVRAAIRAVTGYEPRFEHFPVVGLCPPGFGQGAGAVS
jgi:Fur family transcriptional regulator, ferric uptake regulator